MLNNPCVCHLLFSNFVGRDGKHLLVVSPFNSTAMQSKTCKTEMHLSESIRVAKSLFVPIKRNPIKHKPVFYNSFIFSM